MMSFEKDPKYKFICQTPWGSREFFLRPFQEAIMFNVCEKNLRSKSTNVLKDEKLCRSFCFLCFDICFMWGSSQFIPAAFEGVMFKVCQKILRPKNTNALEDGKICGSNFFFVWIFVSLMPMVKQFVLTKMYISRSFSMSS